MARSPRVRIFLVFAAAYFLSYSFRSVGAIIAPDLAHELQLNPRELGLLASVYFLTFFLAQPVIGVTMDRYGPARVNAVLMAIAAAGAAMFAAGDDLTALALGRALIGLGVAGALMTSFKAFVVWYAPRHREALSGGMMAVGGLAAVVTASPAEVLMRMSGWRGLFWLLCVLSVLAAALLLLAIPPGATAAAGKAAEPAVTRDGGYRAIFTSRIFVSYAPLALFGSGGFSAIQSLWAGPWLAEVAALSRADAAHVLLIYGAGLLIGYLAIAFLGSRVQATPNGPRNFFVTSLALAYCALGAIISNAWPQSASPWFTYGLTLGAGMLAYPALLREFPAAIAGRVVTAYNMLMFMGAFALQSGIGALIQLLIELGQARVAAYQEAFGVLLALQVFSLVWFVLLSRSRAR